MIIVLELCNEDSWMSTEFLFQNYLFVWHHISRKPYGFSSSIRQQVLKLFSST